MSPERQAEAAIERAITDHRECDPPIIARAAVEAMAAAKLVMLTAARAQRLLAERDGLNIALGKMAEDKRAWRQRAKTAERKLDAAKRAAKGAG